MLLEQAKSVHDKTRAKHQAEVDLEPFKGLLLGLFFMTVGMGLDLPAIIEQPHIVLLGLVLLLAIKLVAGFVATRLMTGNRQIAIETSFYLAPAGEFAFVVTAAAIAAGIIPSDIAAMVAAIAGISMLITPAMATAGRKLSVRFAPKINPDSPIQEFIDLSAHTGHVVIAGFGRVGNVVARILSEEAVEMVALDSNLRNIKTARDAGIRAYLGDASRPEMLESVGLDGARAFIITVDNPAIVEAMVRSVRKTRPDIFIMARAHDQSHAAVLEAAGANYVVPEVVETGLQLAGQALRRSYGYEYETVRNLLAADRDREYHSDDPDADVEAPPESEPESDAKKDPE